MKQYFNFLRSSATVLLAVLYVGVSLFSFSPAYAEDIIETVDEIVSQEISDSGVVEDIESYEFVAPEESPFLDSEVIFSQQVEVDPLENIVSEQNDSLREVSEEAQEISVKICNEVFSPVLLVDSTYVELNISDIAIAESIILDQVNPTATDSLDGVLSVSNTLDALALNPGLNSVEFFTQNSVDCVTSVTVDIMVIDQVQPVCQSGFVYAKITFPESLTAALGTNVSIQSGDWFPVMVNGVTFSESESAIVINPDIAITRVGTTLFVNVAPGVTDADILAESIANSVQFSGGSVVSALAFSGDVAVIDFQAEECLVDVCAAFGGPSIISFTETVIISENSTLSPDEVFALFGLTAEDLDGEGLVTITSNISSISYLNAGTYTVTATLTDDEGCVSLQTLTLVVDGGDDEEEEEDDNGGGRRRTGTRQEPEGEVLGAATCEPYLTTFLKMGHNNPKDEVIKLQTFLNDYMNENLVVDGIYGQATFEAVKRFQTQEFDEVLKPWGITEPTGITRETTTRRINNIMCPELNLQMPILYCATTGNVLFPDGTVITPEGAILRSNSVVNATTSIPEVLSKTNEQKPVDENYSWVPTPVVNPETGRSYEK